MKRRRRMSPRVAGPRSPLASGRARADTVDRSRPRGISLLSLGRTEARMAEAARPERAALPSFSTFSTMAGLAAEALTDSLSHRGGEGKVVVSSRSGYPMRVMSGLLCIRGIPTRRTPNRSRSETRASVRVARDFALKRRAAIRRARRLVLARVPRRIARRATSPSLARTPSGPSKHRIAAPSASRKPKFPDGVCRPYSPLVGADRGGARDDGGGGDASHLSCWS